MSTSARVNPDPWIAYAVSILRRRRAVPSPSPPIRCEAAPETVDPIPMYTDRVWEWTLDDDLAVLDIKYPDPHPPLPPVPPVTAPPLPPDYFL